MAVKLRASKVQPLAATTPTYLDYEGLVELVSKLKATYATQLSLDDYLTISAAASTYQPIGDYATDDTIYSLKSTILKQWAVHCEDGEILSYTSSSNQLTLTSRGFGSDVDDDWGSRLYSSYTTNVYVRTICGEHIFGSTTDIDVASLIGLSSYALKTDIPTNVSAFTNDAGYITAADVVEPDLSGYVTTSSLTTTLADYAKTSDLPTLSSLGGVGSVSASGTSPLTLSASKSGTTVAITGSVDLSAYATTATLSSDYYTKTQVDSLLEDATGGGVTTVNASGTSPLTLSASKSGTTVEITGSVDLSSYVTSSSLTSTLADYAKSSDIPTLSSLSGIGTVTASGTSPLTLSASKSGTTVAISGSVDLSAYATTSDLSNYVTSSSLTSTLADYAKASDIPTLSSLSGIGTVTASGTSPLTLSASKSGTSVTISGSVDLSSYATQSWVQEQIADAVTGGTVDLSAYLTKSEAASTYQPIGNYTTSSDFKTINGNSIIGSGDITISGGGDVDLSEYATKSWVEEQLAGFTSDGITSISMTGDSVLSFNVSESNGAVVITGSANTYTKSEISSMISTASGGGITGATANATSPLSLSTSVSDGLLTITGGVDLSDYAKTSDLSSYVTSSSLNSTLSSYAKTSDIPTLSSLGGVGSVSASGTSPLTLSASKSGTSVAITGSVDLSNYATQAWVQEQITEAVTGDIVDLSAYLTKSEAASTYQPIGDYATNSYVDSLLNACVQLSDYEDYKEAVKTAFNEAGQTALSTSGNTTLQLITSYPTDVDLSNYTGKTTSVTFKTINGNSLFGSGDITIDGGGGTVDLSAYSTTTEIQDVLLWLAEHDGLSQQTDGVTLRLTRYYPRVFGSTYTGINSDVTFKTVAGESIFGSGDVALDDFADKATTLSMMQGMMGGLEYVKGSDHSLHINYSQPTAWGTVSHGSSDYVSIHWATLNGLCLFGTDDDYSIEDLGGVSSNTIATADELGLVRPYYNSTFSGNNADNLLGRAINAQSSTSGRYYGVEALNGRLYVNVPWEGSDVNLSDYATQAWVQEYVTDVVTGGTVDLTAYATKSDVMALAYDQYSCFWATVTESSTRTTVGFDFWLPDRSTITGGDENQRFALYFANINGNSIVSTSSSGISNLTISDLGGLASGDLKTVAGESLIGSGNIDPTPWAVKIDGIDEVPGYITNFIGNTAFNTAYVGVIYSSGHICPYVTSGSTATVYANWTSQDSLKYNDSTGANASARTDLVFVYDDAAYVFNGYALNKIGENGGTDQATLEQMRAQYPSATLLSMKETWFNTSLDNFNWVNAKIMDYDNETGSCRIRFGISDYGSSQTFAVRLIAAYSNEMQGSDNYYTALTSTASGDCMAYFDLVVQYDEKTGSFPETYRKYYIEVDA